MRHSAHAPVRFLYPGVLILIFSLLASPVVRGADLTDKQVDDAIAKMKKWLYSQQDEKTGSWEDPAHAKDGHFATHTTGQTAIVVMSLLASGETVHDPRIKKALKFLRETTTGGTYAVGLRAHVWAMLPPQYEDMLSAEAEWLKSAHSGSVFDYEQYVRQGRVDHSVTQYGVLGLWEYSKRGGKVDDNFWKLARKHFLSTQNADGGWGYSVSDQSYASMTTAGLTVLFIAQQQAFRDQDKPDPEITKAVDKGLKWLDERFDGPKNMYADGEDRGYPFYHLYGIERVALASGVKFLNGKDWFEAGADYTINKALRSNGSVGPPWRTAFALSFLSRGRVPVWINKLAVPGAKWNNRPNDVYFWNAFLSDSTERDLNWQLVNASTPPELWRNAPVLYLSSDEKIDFNTEQKANIKRYIDLGGTFLAVAQKGSRTFAPTIQALGREMYPDLRWERVKPDDLLYNIHHSIPRDKMQNIHVLSNGARDLIYLVENDWSMDFQRDNPPGQGTSWQVASNFFALATNRGMLDNRLVHVLESRTKRKSSGDVIVGRAKYRGGWNPEPLTWEVFGTHLFNKTGLRVKVEDVELEQLGSFKGKLVHLSGTQQDVKLSEEQLSGIRQFVENGGTLLIENVGGKSGFASQVEGLIKTINPTSALQLEPDHPIVSGEKLKNGYEIGGVSFTRSTVTRIKVDDRPRLRAFYVKEKPAIILSSEDLSLALLDVRQWGILGYTRESAQKLMTNIVLWSQK